MNTVAVIQARMGSTRLPGKVMKTVLGRPLLAYMVDRVRAARTSLIPVVATTVDPADDPIRELARAMSIDCYSGHPTDLLDRHYRCAREFDAQVVLKIPSDCPLIDPNVIDLVLNKFLAAYPRYDYVSNLHPASFPDGNDVEVMTMGAISRAMSGADRSFEREHTTPYIWERPGRFNIGNVVMPGGHDYSMTYRWTLDYPEDLDFISTIIERLYPVKRLFSLHDLLTLLEAEPGLCRINTRHAGVNWYYNYLHELKTVGAHQTRKGCAA
jgi:spore coat polysaccharide biosynthesis protein SpsF